MGDGELKSKIINVLENQGFKINPHVRPASNTKAAYRELQQQSRTEQITLHQNFLKSKTQEIQNFILKMSRICIQRDLEGQL